MSPFPPIDPDQRTRMQILKQHESTAKQEGEEGEAFFDEDASTDASEGAEGEFAQAKNALDGVQL